MKKILQFMTQRHVDAAKRSFSASTCLTISIAPRIDRSSASSGRRLWLLPFFGKFAFGSLYARIDCRLQPLCLLFCVFDRLPRQFSNFRGLFLSHLQSLSGFLARLHDLAIGLFFQPFCTTTRIVKDRPYLGLCLRGKFTRLFPDFATSLCEL